MLAKGKIGLFEIATEPIAIVVHKMQELPESVLVDLKCLAKELLGNFEKRKEFLMLQDMIRRRVDLTEQTLLHANMTQLEILYHQSILMYIFPLHAIKDRA